MVKEAWIIFRNGEHKLQRILKDGFGHITILYRDKFNWMLLSPNSGILETIILPYGRDENAPQWLANSPKFTVLGVSYNDKSDVRWFPRFLIGFTCVSFTKYFLGYKGYSITPYGLYKSLKKLTRNIIKVEELKCHHQIHSQNLTNSGSD